MKKMRKRLGRAYKNRVFVIAALASLYILALSGLALAQVAVTRHYRFNDLVSAYRGADERGPLQAEIILEVENTDAASLGRPLPGAMPPGWIMLRESAKPRRGSSGP